MKVFISHSSDDKKFVRTLKDDLVANGIDCWLDEDQLEIGDSLIQKLESAINESTHFIIILSPNSVSSEWVRLELSKANLLKDASVLKKIIPIKYRECEMPKDLIGLLYGDLSNVAVQVSGNNLIMIGNGYTMFLEKLIQTLKSSDKELSKEDKNKLKNEINVFEKKEQKDTLAITKPPLQVFKLYLKVIKFLNAQVVYNYRNGIKEKTKINEIKIKQDHEIFPVIFPTIFRYFLIDIPVGEQFIISKNHMFYSTVHFSGYRRDANFIGIPGNIRKALEIFPNKTYLFEFDMINKTINIRTI